MKKFTIQAIFLLLVIGAGLFLYSTNPSLSNLPFLPQTTVVKELQINEAKLKVEIADTKEKRSKGLGGRANLAEDEGMLFVFPKSDKYPFWMKGLSFPIDFVWIRGDKVVDILANVPSPSPGQSDESLPIYSSKEEVDKVLEVNSGAVQRLNIKVGDSVKIL